MARLQRLILLHSLLHVHPVRHPVALSRSVRPRETLGYGAPRAPGVYIVIMAVIMGRRRGRHEIILVAVAEVARRLRQAVQPLGQAIRILEQAVRTSEQAVCILEQAVRILE